jgi:hypothetical protein
MLHDLAMKLHEHWPLIVGLSGSYLALRWFMSASKRRAAQRDQYLDRLRNE